MKKTLLILAISALTLSLNAYVPMIKNGKQWTRFFIDPTNPTKYFTNTYSITADTVINGQTYHSADFTKVFFREDTVEQRIYVLDTSRGYEELLYDFSLNIGDSTQIYCDDNTLRLFADSLDKERNCRIFITAIDTVIGENDILLRRFTYESIYTVLDEEKFASFTYIEGCGMVGDKITDIINRKYKQSYNGGYLRCVIEPDGTLLYKGHSSSQMDEVLGDDCIGSGKVPNATIHAEMSNISLMYGDNVLSVNAENIDNVEIFTAAGVMVGCYQSSEINISLTPGIYFARIAADGRVSTERFIVK